MLWKSIVILALCASTPLFTKDRWKNCKKETVSELSSIAGTCSKEKAQVIMDIIRENKCQICVEIGVYSGKSLMPIAKALKYNGSGKVYAIDAWDMSEATSGFSRNNPKYIYWSEQDYDALYKQTQSILKKNKVDKYCELIKRPSRDIADLFADNSIDFLHLDGSQSEESAIEDVINYFPKVKNGGFILLSEANMLTMKRSLVFLLERANLISAFKPSASYYLFRKSNQRLINANLLMNENEI